MLYSCINLAVLGAPNITNTSDTFLKNLKKFIMQTVCGFEKVIKEVSQVSGEYEFLV